MAAIALRRDERIGLGLAVAAHAGLVAWLALSPHGSALVLPPERMTVTLSDDIAVTSTAPQPAPAPAPDEASVLGERAPQPVAAPPRPTPVPLVSAAPVKPAVQRAPAARPVPPKAKSAPAPAKPAGGSRIGSDFLKGVSGAQGQSRTPNPPAAAVGPGVKTALAAAIMRQIKPKWQGRVPQGVDTENLVSVIAIDLNADGSLAGSPRLLAQEGINDANRAQARRHAEEAIRAVQLAAPFTLPAELYDAWKKPPALRMRKSI